MTVAVEITDQVVQQMLASPKFRKVFPFMATAYAKTQSGVKKCGTCGRKRKQNLADVTFIRASIGAMSPQHKSQLRQLLGAEQVVVRYPNRKGKTVTQKF